MLILRGYGGIRPGMGEVEIRRRLPTEGFFVGLQEREKLRHIYNLWRFAED